MKQFSHAWLAFKAIERLEKANLSANYRIYASELIRWFWDHRDGVIKGAWYPDMVFKDMATSHVLKHEPSAAGTVEVGKLPYTCKVPDYAEQSAMYGQPYAIADKNDNLPERCEALAHAVIDTAKMQETEHKGSPIVTTDNHIAARLFILSHYIADAHMPLHCDDRKFSRRPNIHAKMEAVWDHEIRTHYKLDLINARFYYNPEGYPLRTDTDYSNSFLKHIDDGLSTRPFSTGYGAGNNNVLDYMRSVCQNSFMLAYAFFPPGYDHTNVTTQNWKRLPEQTLDFDKLSLAVFNDAIDAIARVWLRVWRRYVKWVNR